MKNQFAKIVAVLMVLAMAVSVFSICAFAADTTTEANVALLGDVNLDGRVTIQDATLLQKSLAKLATLDEVQTAVADADENGSVNIKDATAIQKWIAKYADANQNIGQPLVATEDEPATPDVPATEDQPATPDVPATEDEPATGDEPATEDENPATPDVPATEDEKPATPDVPATEDQPIVEPEKFYTVAGAEGLCGVNWDPAQNVMTNDGDGTWSITFTGVAAGTYEFKVVENGAWGNPDFNLEGNAAGGGANAKVEVLVDGATVIIGFDGEKAVIEFVTAPEVDDEPATKDEEPATKDEATADEATADEATADEVTYYLVGYINGADVTEANDAYAFVDGTLTVTLTGDSDGNNYVQVLCSDGTLYVTDGWKDFGNTELTLAKSTDVAEANKFAVASGELTFTWNAETLVITVA